MSVPYLLRLACLCAACFFLMHTAIAVAVAAIGRLAVRLAEGMAADRGARLLLGLRLLPAVAAGIAVAAVCLPSYLWLEPEGTAERVGWPCLAVALVGAGICAAGLARAARAVVRSQRYVRNCRAAAEGDSAVVLLAGVWRPRLVVSRGVRRALAQDQLAAAVRHERAHRERRDNLKRLLLAASPWAPGLKALERGWARMAEWAADDRAAAGDAGQAVALAEALVRVARMGGGGMAAAPLAAGLMADAGDLEVRVERLLNPRATLAAARTRRWVWAGAALTAVTAMIIEPGTLVAAHRVLEELMR
jgi:Zn-dependent protease with chaperone function